MVKKVCDRGNVRGGPFRQCNLCSPTVARSDSRLCSDRI